MDQSKEPKSGKSKLRKLVYAGLAGGMVGVCISATAHGNASPGGAAGQTLTWESDDFVLHKDAQAAREAQARK